MTLSEIETILGELSERHPDLDTELLNKLLLSAGWEEKNIKDALLLFKQGAYVKSSNPDMDRVAENVASVAPAAAPHPVQLPPQEAITFYQPDGTEEGDLHVPEIPNQVRGVDSAAITVSDVITTVVDQLSSPQQSPDISSGEVKSPEKDVLIEHVSGSVSEIKIAQAETIEVIKEKSVQATGVATEPHQVSLVVPQEGSLAKMTQKESVIPANLPVVPFESSSHVLPFSQYETTFHQEEKHEEVLTGSVPVVDHKETEQEIPKTENKEVEDIGFEKTPLSTGDESLVFLAAVMLLVIILILGYMYSNGRL